MQNTSCGCNCPFIKSGFCKNEKECPNYVESWWVEGESQKPILLKDCSPKRMLLQQQLLQSRLESMQQSLDKARNEYVQLCEYLKNLLEISKAVILQKDSQNLIEEDHAKIPSICNFKSGPC
jgi:hypothetical protein